MKTTLVVAILALVLAGTATGASYSLRTLSDAHVGRSKQELIAQEQHSKQVIAFFTRHHWMMAPRHATCWSHVPWSKTCNAARKQVRLHRWLYGLAKNRLDALYPQVFAPAVASWLWSAFLCIHRYEGAWNANTGNGYYGGLQMDLGFQSLYGSDYLARYGTADRWPPAVQIAVAVRAYESGRGFGPWPSTARACGLL